MCIDYLGVLGYYMVDVLSRIVYLCGVCILVVRGSVALGNTECGLGSIV